MSWDFAGRIDEQMREGFCQSFDSRRVIGS